MYAINAVGAQLIKNWVATNDNSGTVAASNNALEMWAGFLAANGGTGTRVPELESSWLSSQGATGVRWEDKWQSFLLLQGFTGTLQQNIRDFFSGATPLVGTAFSDFLLENGSYFLLESGAGNVFELEG